MALASMMLATSESLALKVENIKISGLTTISEQNVLDIMTLKEGDEFSIEALDISLGHLRKWGVFDAIEAHPEMAHDGVIVKIRMEEGVIVNSVDITGNYPFLANKIRKYLSLHAGDIYTPKRLLEQIERIEAFYKRQGFVGTVVHVDEEIVPEDNGIALTFHINRGKIIRYNDIIIEGNVAFPDGRFVSAINPLRPYSERRLRESLRDLKDFYRAKGYPRAKIRIKEKKIDYETMRLDLAISVDEGPHIIMDFKGSPGTSRRLLKKAVTIMEEGATDEFEIEISSNKIEKLLRKRGYPDAKVTGNKSIRDDGTIIVTFNLEEGKSSRIRLLTFKGNKDVGKALLSENMQNRSRSFKRSGAFYPKEIKPDDEAISLAMKSKGYLDAKVSEWIVRPVADGYAVDIAVPIEPGHQTIISSIKFEGDVPFEKKLLLREIWLKEGKPFDEPGLEDDRERLLKYLADNGYPYASVKASWSFDVNDEGAVIIFTIQSDKMVKIGRILIVGDVLTSQKALKRAMAIKEGEPFSYRKILESQLNIRRLGPFSSVNVTSIGLEDRESTVHLRVKVEEQRPFRIDMGISYSTDEKFTGSLTFSNINSFGWAKTNTLKLTGGQKLSRAELAWHDPRFLGSPFEMTANGWVQYKSKPAYSFVQAGGALGWFRRYSRMGILFRWEIDRNYFITGDSVAADKDSLRDNIMSQTSITPSYDTRDSFADPRSGYYTIARANIFNEIKGNHANFFKLFWAGEINWSPWRRMTFANNVRFGRILTVGKNVSVPTNELLFLGGDDTVRGYSEDSLGPVDAAGKAVGGRLEWIYNSEIRIRLISHLQLAGFFDMGSLTNSFDAIGWNSTVRSSAGAGLRFITPVGPIRLDYGFKLDRKIGESIGRLHFTFGYVF
jgi:outer membrane protein insertion porin family